MRLSPVGLGGFFLALGGFVVTLLDYVAPTDLLPAHLQNHVSNFAVSGMLCLSAGLLLASVRARWYTHLVAPVVAAVGNYVVEARMVSSNTRDMTDFRAGVLGALLGFVVGVLIAAVGMRRSGQRVRPSALPHGEGGRQAGA